ncbi:MAG: hypothetical protein KC643_15070 [Nitrospira sp.]|nr:hypothetical protein [Nitrospira sp.]
MTQLLALNPRPGQVPAIQLLFLSEGYARKLDFEQDVDRIYKAFITIPLFSQATVRLAAWSHFVASSVGQVGKVEKDTAFGLFLDSEDKLTTLRPQRVIDAINNIQVSIPHLNDPLNYIDASEVWLGRLSPRESIVCVLANNIEASSTTIVDWPTGLVEPTILTQEVQELLPCIFLSSWALSQGSSVQYTNPQMAVALVLAKQVGRVMGLADEQESPGQAFETYLEKDPLDPAAIKEPDWPNITAHASLLDETGQLQIDQLKWNYQIHQTKRKTIGFAESAHPIPPSGASEEQIGAQYGRIAKLSKDSVLLLRHPGFADPLRKGPNIERYVYGGRQELKLNGQINLFEGAGGYRHGLYRSSSECLMRFEGYDSQLGSTTTRKEVGFCLVCKDHIQREISGFRNFSLDGVKIKKGSERSRKWIESRLAKLIHSYVIQTGNDPWFTNGQGSCVEVTSRRFEEVFNDKLKWSMTRSVKTGTPSEPWYQARTDFPYLTRNPLRAWAIWNTRLGPSSGTTDPHAIPNWNSPNWKLRWAGLGAPGAIVYAGFGSLANARSLQSLTNNGRTIHYRGVRTLQSRDFQRIAPGSLLQIWRPGVYEKIIAFVSGIDTHPSNHISERWWGHSLFFMGLDSNGDPLVADQYGVTQSLVNDWGEYSFWIAAQWFDATGITLL